MKKKPKKQSKFTVLTMDDRRVIERMHGQKKPRRFSVAEIAAAIGKNRSTVYRELAKGRYEHLLSDWTTEVRYSADKGQAQADAHRANGGRKLKIDRERDKKFIAGMVALIKDGRHSPAAALAAIRKRGGECLAVGVKTVYRYIHKKIINVIRHLPAWPYRKSRYAKITPRQRKRGIPLPGKSIEKRPEEVLGREEFGHWEMDTVMGPLGKSKHSLLVLTERKTRYELVALLARHTAECVVAQLDRLEHSLKTDFGKIFKSFSLDNGSEFADAAGMAAPLSGAECFRTALYYCHPRAAFERGSNENNNKLIRRFVPKGKSFDGKTEEDIAKIQAFMNAYPRKLLDWDSSGERLMGELAALGLHDPANARNVFCVPA